MSAFQIGGQPACVARSWRRKLALFLGRTPLQSWIAHLLVIKYNDNCCRHAVRHGDQFAASAPGFSESPAYFLGNVYVTFAERHGNDLQ